MADDKHEERVERPAPTSQDEAGRNEAGQDEAGSHHVADEPVGDADALGATVQKPTTETGLSVEEQVRKEWDPKKDGGLPIPLHDEAQ